MIDTSGLPVLRVAREPHAELDRTAWPATLPCVRQVLDEGLELGPLTILIGENGSGKSWQALALQRGIGASRWGFFLRAETMHGFYSYLEDNPSRHGEPRFHEMSHGESFLAVLDNRFTEPGLYLLDEPESALSFRGSLALVGLLARIAASRTAQAIVATHSPIVAATPGARILEVGETGLVARAWPDLELVANWTAFLADPGPYLRHVVD